MPATGRRLGLSRYGKAPSLLKSLNRPENSDPALKPRDDGFSELEQPHAQQLFIHQRKQDDDIYGPPVDSDDEEEEIIVRPPQSSDEEDAGRGDIVPTNFKTKASLNRQTTPDAPKDDSDIDGFSPIRDQAPAKSSESLAATPSLRRSRRNGSDSTNNIPKKARTETDSVYKLKELEDFSTAPESKLRRKTFKRYGSQSKSQGSRSSQSNSDTSPKVAFKKPRQLELEMSVSPLKTFKLPGQLMIEVPEEEPEKTLKTFDLPAHSPNLSPCEEREVGLEPGTDELSPLYLDSPVFGTGNVMDIIKQSRAATKELTDRMPFRALENGEDAQSQVPVFQMPPPPPALTAGSHPEASEVRSSEANSVGMTPMIPEVAPEAACPMCGDPVNALFLKKYNNGKRMNIRVQTRFCRAHKKKSAKNEWAEKGYPAIDWINLDGRFIQHHPYLKNILDGAPSYYRNILAEQVKSGKDRTLLQAVKNSQNTLTPGYYGSRGFRAMSENIMQEFASQLRRIAITDRLVAARGVTGYVQFVLVPELAVKLICEDLGLGVEEARQVMRESVTLGDLVNEEVEDVVTWKEGDETL